MLKLPNLIGAYVARSNVPLTPAAQYFADCLLFAIETWRKANPAIFADAVDHS